MRGTRRLLWSLSLVATLALAACGEDAVQPGPPDDHVVVEGEIRPTFELNQTWVVGTIYRQATMRLPEDAVTLSRDPDAEALDEFIPYIPAAVRPPEGELWSEVIYWQFGVINTDYIPDPESSFYELSLDVQGTPQPITIIKAIAPKAFNGEAISEQLDPVFYLVLRESDYRVRGIHFNYRVPGGRNTVVLELPENTSGNPEPGADLNYFLVDYFMPVFPLDDTQDYNLTYGGGSARERMTVSRIDAGAVEVTFNSAMDNMSVRQRWDQGQPWFSYSATEARVSWLAGEAELADLMEANGVDFLTNEAFLEDAEAIARKFRNRINLQQELRVSPGTFERSAPQTHLPWAGDFWATRRGALVMGFSGQGRSISNSSPTRQALTGVTNDEGKTLEDRIRALDQELDALLDIDQNAEDFDRAAFNQRVQDYYAEKRAVVQELRNWFEEPNTGFVARVKAGDVDLSDVNNWAPLDKWGLYLLANGVRRPFEAAIWEAGTQYHPGGPGWWGKCNGWSAAAILYDEPRDHLTVDLDLAAINGGTGTLRLTMQTADLKGLLSASNYSGYSLFYGERYNGSDDDVNDLYPAVFHRIITYYIGTEHFPLVFDTTATEQVWNFPAYAYRMTITEGPQNEAENCQTMHVEVDLRFATDSVSEDHVDGEGAEPQGFWNEYRYDLCVRNGVVRGDGTWTGSEHPDFAWVPYQNDQRLASAHSSLSTSRRDSLFFGDYAPSENPFLYTDRLEALTSPRVNAPQVCNPEPNDCPGGQICVVETGLCREREGGEDPSPGCGGGETQQTAELVTTTSLTDQQICSGRDSWYAFDVAAGQRITVTVTFPHSQGDIDIALIAPNGQQVRSDSTSDTETVSATATQAGRYVLKVYGYSGAENTVTIAVEMTDANGGGTSDCQGEADEPNNSVESATAVGEVSGRRAEICTAGEDDYYRIGLEGAYTASIDFSNAVGDLDLQLLSLDGQPQRSSESTNDHEEVNGDGPAILRVYGWNGAVGEYTLTIRAN